MGGRGGNNGRGVVVVESGKREIDLGGKDC